MLYFDDFMEAIENLPSELNESLTSVRQLDLQAQNILDSLNETVPIFFEEYGNGKLSENEKNSQITDICRDYDLALNHNKEKREIVENIYNTYHKLVRKLDIELEKFRLELEADNSGVTEQIEKRRRQRFRFQQSGHCKSNFVMRKKLVGQAFRAAFKSACMRPHTMNRVSDEQKTTNDKIMTFDGSNTPTAFCKNVDLYHRSFAINSDLMSHPIDYADTNIKISDLQGNASAMDRNNENFTLAAPIASLTKVDEDGVNIHSGLCPTSMKSTSYAIQDQMSDTLMGSSSVTKTQIISSNNRMLKLNNHPNGQLLYSASETCSLDGTPSDIHPLEGSMIPGWANVTPSLSGTRDRRRYSRRANMGDDYMHDDLKMDDSMSGDANTPDHLLDDQPYDFIPNPKLGKLDDLPEEDEDYKRYCVCRDISYGDMIACDAPDCPYEWFHYACVSLTVAPKGRWFCPSCSKSLANKRSIKKNSRK